MGAACTGLAAAGQGWGAALVSVTWCCGRPGKCSSGALAPLCGGTSHAGLEAPLVSGEAALSGASEVEDLSLIPLGLRCRFPNSTGKPLPLVCVEKAQLRPASFSAEGICLSPQAAGPRSRLPSVYSWVFSFQGPLGLWSCVNAWGRGWGTLGSGAVLAAGAFQELCLQAAVECIVQSLNHRCSPASPIKWVCFFEVLYFFLVVFHKSREKQFVKESFHQYFIYSFCVGRIPVQPIIH